MKRPGKLWIDDEGVRRGYYVYIHKDKQTGSVFYVGKGHGRRAWETRDRNDRWVDHVSKLENGWEVELVETDLSEIVAFQLEEKLVKEYGGSIHDGGTLTNLVHGGENPISVGIGFELVGDPEPIDIGQSADWSRTEQVDLAKEVCIWLQRIMDRIQVFVDEEPEDGDDIDDLEIIVGSAFDNGFKEFIRRRISWPDFCGSIEELVEDLVDEEYKEPRVEQLRRLAVEEGQRTLMRIRGTAQHDE